jgi:DNA mismatch repair ATPase MutS
VQRLLKAGRKVAIAEQLEDPSTVKGPKAIVKRGFSGVISLHTEYMKGDTKDPAFVKASLEAFKRDIGVLKGWMA